MSTLTDAELDAMRADIEDVALPNTGAILSVTNVSDGQGGFTASWGTVAVGVSYRMDYKTGNEQLAGGGRQPFSYWQITLPYNTSVTTANRFQDEDGNTYNISSIDKRKSWNLFISAVVEAV